MVAQVVSAQERRAAVSTLVYGSLEFTVVLDIPVLTSIAIICVPFIYLFICLFIPYYSSFFFLRTEVLSMCTAINFPCLKPLPSGTFWKQYRLLGTINPLLFVLAVL
ncbi:hypothetical protein Y032_0043g787 [Ancylostoma ceylanicum]|uniref:Uncharacterized protein n=1 Tax=Ancylostoma ceylanicum TaxID=53326 RepID=A0A016UFA3_9BILA|nr:hypothetical protein Y032_0043g787 [Ancylostoma ceylanicum]